ncbi:MAG TPA: chemotaxis response regulator protein-glutamate methylesterase [Gemmatimonadaceae bacterium]|nr:chemotaxis response regulator protein-glutamate methylesterase [Gemmatimonadaceae bacterium]
MTSSGIQPIRVLIVDDSAVVRGVLGRIVDEQDDMRVATTAMNGRDALDALRLQEIDVVLLDIEMPVMDGLTALPLIVQRHPRVRVLVTSSLTQESAKVTMRALALGAVDYVYKPSTRGGGIFGVEAAATQVIAKIRAVAGSGTAGAAPPTNGTRHVQPPSGDFEPQVLALAASTGGPNALAIVVSGLPRDFPLPVLVTQHMPPIFTTMFAQRLARESSLPCDEAHDGEALQPGRIYVAPGDHHLTVIGGGLTRSPVLHITSDPPEHHCRPAADPMFRTAAQAFPNGVLAVVLTGMGDDGRRGCQAVAASGGRVIVQDETTSVVWGMPGSVVASGIPCSILPLRSISTHVASLCPVRS